MISIEHNVFKTSRNKLLDYLLNVLEENTHITQGIPIRHEKCLDIIDDVVLKMNESVYFSQDAPDNKMVEDWECCKNKLYEVGAIINDNNTEIMRVTDDLKMSRFLIDCNMEDDCYEL